MFKKNTTNKKIFYENLFNCINIFSDIFPNELYLKNLITQFKLYKKLNSISLLKTIIIQLLSYKKYIFLEDEEYFNNLDIEKQDLNEEQKENIKYIKSLYIKINSNEQKKIIWKYLQIIIMTGEKIY